jgi:uncharacterized protein YceK
MSPMTLFILTCSLMLIGCGTATSRRAPDAGKTTQKAIQKIDRICALPQLGREWCSFATVTVDPTSLFFNCLPETGTPLAVPPYPFFGPERSNGHESPTSPAWTHVGECLCGGSYVWVTESALLVRRSLQAT